MADLVFGLAKSAVEGALTMAKSAMEEEAKQRKDMKHHLMLISDEFETMHSVLSVAAKDDAVTDDVTRTVVRQVRDLALDMEDCIEFAVSLDSGKSNSCWGRIPLLQPCLPAALTGPVADLDAAVAEFELLKARVEAMGQRNLRYSRIGGPDAKPAAGKQTRLQQPAAAAGASGSDSLVMVREAARRKKKTLEFADMIISKNGAFAHQLQVLSVLGNFGTMSIIKSAYDDPTICQSFRCRAWVKLMHPFNPYEFIRCLLPQFYKNGCPPMELKAVATEDDDDLIHKFIKEMSNHKYLVVLEDVSTMVHWESVKACLPDGNNGSCIVVNTHHVEVAALCVGCPHSVLEFEKLSTDYSVYVFFKKKEVAEKAEENIIAHEVETAQKWKNENPLFGRDIDLIEGLYWVVGEVREVATVWGMSGVGKSFLVRHLYHHLQIDGFHILGDPRPTFGWVDVSRPFDLLDLSRSLFLDLNPGYFQNGIMMAKMKDPIQACREYLHQHYCFIVIDGLQSMEEWDLIRAALELGTSISRFMVIANEESVARYCAAPARRTYNVKGLAADHAFQLLKEALSHRYPDSTTTGELKRILHKCGGLPKVICAAADIILRRSNCYSYFEGGNLVSALEDEAALTKQSINHVLAWWLSYLRSCPDFLKPCVFYLAIFPLNSAIRRRRLVRRWIAEGYSRANEKGNAEEFGEMSYSKLVNLSMVQVPPISILGTRVPLCEINGFLREFIKSRSMEENLVFALEAGHCSKGLQHTVTGRHLAVDKSWNRDRDVFNSMDLSRLRSLTVVGEWGSFFVSGKMRLLRVLDLEGVSSGLENGDVEKMVEMLPRLKFLSLRRCKEISRLPDSLGDRLKQLQTLDIRGTTVMKLPKSINKLEKLQYLRAGGGVSIGDDIINITSTPAAPAAGEKPSTPLAASSMMGSCMTQVISSWFSKWRKQRCRPDADGSHDGVKVPRGIGSLSNLHTLGVVDLLLSDAAAAGKEEGVVLEEELKNLTHLHKLGVSGINRGNRHRLFSAISSALAHLESLSIHVQEQVPLEDQEKSQQASCCLDYDISEETKTVLKNLCSLKLYGLVRRLPEWTKELENLKKLTLQMTVLPQERIDVLESLGGLRSLRLFLSEFQADGLHFSGHFSLDFLEISCSSRLQATITFLERDDLGPSIEVLRIRCWRASSLQISGVQHVLFLKEVWLSGLCDIVHQRHFERELAKYPEDRIKPILKLEDEPDSSATWLLTSS